ncbi:MAG: helix-turn-helix domain-containing protein [Clostridiales bacterium]|nr:helix-turn-helix domain-containing protein [Clostridiales bacterium]
MNYVKRIRDLREDHDYTQEYVAKRLGTSQSMYARYERAANELPIHHLLTLCDLYRVSADYILGRTDQPEAYPSAGES